MHSNAHSGSFYLYHQLADIMRDYSLKSVMNLAKKIFQDILSNWIFPSHSSFFKINT